MDATLEDPLILLFEKKISSLQPMLPILEADRAIAASAADHR